MKIDFIPEDYTPVEQGLLFGFSTESDTPIDVEVEIIDADSEEVVAVQILREVVSGVVNIAPYVQRFSEREPLASTITACSIKTFELEKARYKIRIGDVESAAVVVSPLKRVITAPDMVTDMPLRRRFSNGESDEVIFVVDGPTDVVAYIEADNGNAVSLSKRQAEGAVRLAIASSHFGKGVKHISVEIELDDNLWQRLEYEVVPRRKHAVRLAWESASGSIERYSFPMCYEQRCEVKKQRCETDSGFEAVAINHIKSIRLLSDYEPRSVISALADIIASPKVWIDSKTSGLKRVEVLSSTEKYNLFGEPDCIELELLETQRRESL